MKAVIMTGYGPPDALQIREVTKPKPKDDEVLIRVFAASAHIGDTRIRKADPFLVRLVFGLFKPRKNLIPGLEISGVVEETGKNVRSFKINDQVFAFTGFGLGGYAEYRCLPEKSRTGTLEKKGLVALKPANLSFEEAATVPAGGLTALKNLQKANLKKGQKILIYGASGSLGTYAIQLAKFFGADVTAVCRAENFVLVQSIGADRVIDYTKEDFQEKDDRYDVIYDAVMKLNSGCKRNLTENGRYVNNTGLPKIAAGDLSLLRDLIEKGILKPVIDRIYLLDEIVDAHRYVDLGHKKGNVAVTIKSAFAN